MGIFCITLSQIANPELIKTLGKYGKAEKKLSFHSMSMWIHLITPQAGRNCNRISSCNSLSSALTSLELTNAKLQMLTFYHVFSWFMHTYNWVFWLRADKKKKK